MKGKRGWIRILEATVAVLIVSGVMITVYSDQSSREEVTISDYSYSLQKQILADIADNSTLRLDALGIEEDLPGDSYYDKLDAFVDSRIPSSFGYLLRVCDLGNLTDFCKMDSKTFIATMESDVFVEEIVISSELGGGGGEEVYSPKKVRLFFWKSGLPEDFCRDVCVEGTLVDECLGNVIVTRSCSDLNNNGCLEDVEVEGVDCLNSNRMCDAGVCVDSNYSKWTCRREVIDGPDYCTSHSRANTICADNDGSINIGDGDCDCNIFGHDCDKHYNCYDWGYWESDCEESPSCADGYSFVSSEPCAP